MNYFFNVQELSHLKGKTNKQSNTVKWVRIKKAKQTILPRPLNTQETTIFRCNSQSIL